MAALPFLMLLAAAQTTFSASSDCPPKGAAYEPGISAKGWAVAPAETPESAFHSDVFGGVTLDLDVPAANYTTNKQLQHDFPFAELDVGELEIGQDGTTTLNGKRYLPNEDCR